MSGETSNLVLADDDQTVRNLLTMHAERGGFTVRSGENGAEALELVTENTDVVLLDLQMPVLDGFGALERLGREHPGVPAVVLTSVDEAAEAVKEECQQNY